MKALVAVKRVVDYNIKVRVKADGSDVDIGNVKIGGSEIVTPLRNTMRFINGNDTNFGLSYFFNKNTNSDI
mgnify:CR=1 FL=1